MLWVADAQPWVGTLRMALPDGGQGTLKDRLAKVRIRAKTGTLDNVSALTGWVWSDAADTWIEFSLLTSGMDEYKPRTSRTGRAVLAARRPALERSVAHDRVLDRSPRAPSAPPAS